MRRKVTPDILGSLMGGAIKQQNNKAGEIENNKEILQESGQEINPEGNKTIKNPKLPREDFRSPQGEGPLFLKEKATFNLPKTTLNDLEDAWIEIRKLRGDKRVSKTDIVAQAIEDSLKEFDLKKSTSKFYGKLASNKTVKT